MKEFLDKYFEPIKNIFFRVGIKSITMDNICSELGISKKTLYKKFDNKNHLVNEIFHRDFYNFKSKIKLAQRNSPDAIGETCTIFKLVWDKQREISTSTLYDLRKYYYPVNDEISEMMHHLLLETLVKTIKRGISEGNYRKDADPVIIANLVSFIFKSFMIKASIKPENLSFSLYNLLDYYLNGTCSQQGKMQYEKQKNGITT